MGTGLNRIGVLPRLNHDTSDYYRRLARLMPQSGFEKKNR